jgi:hypothetical protein
MSSVFISHSSGDGAFVSRLANDLRSHNYDARSIADVVGDSRNLSQSELDQRLREAILADTFFLPVLTPSAVASPWIHKELALAIDSESGSDFVKILPLLSQPCVLPPELGLRSPVDFTRSYDDGLASLLSVLAPPDPASAAVNVALKTSANEPAIREIQEALSNSRVALLDVSAIQFERVIAELLRKQGYEVRLSHRSNDAGIDLIALSGWDAERVPLYVQCKRYVPNRQLTFEWVDSLIASAVSTRLSHAMLVTSSSCFALGKRSAIQKRWRTRSRVDLDRHAWAQLFLWLAESYAGDAKMEVRVTAARERYAQLTEKSFTSQLDEAEQRELHKVEVFLDAAEAPYYEPIKQRLRAIRDQLRIDNAVTSELN